jgi:uncharacterized protein
MTPPFVSHVPGYYRFGGLLCGVVNSIAGGGSLLLFPTLLGLGIPPLAANVTNSVAVWPGWAGAAYGFRGDLRRQSRRRLIALSLMTSAGSTAGCLLLLATPGPAFRVVVPVLVLFASLLLAFQGRARKAAARIQSYPRSRGGRCRVTVVALGMAASGAYGGYFGGAMGVIMLAVLALAFPDSLRALNALKTALSMVDSAISVVILVVLPLVSWRSPAPAAPACLAGGYAGARIAWRVNQELLRWIVVAAGISVSAYLFIK